MQALLDLLWGCIEFFVDLSPVVTVPVMACWVFAMAFVVMKSFFGGSL